MIATKCNISFRVNYTSTFPIEVATATYKHKISQISQTYSIPLDKINSVGSTITLPDIQTPGEYDLTITLKNSNNITATKTSLIKIGNCTGNITPVAIASASATSIVLPNNAVTLNGSATGTTGTVSYMWTKLGLQNVTIQNPNAQSTQVSGLTPGQNTFQLSVTDANTTVTATVAVTVTGVRNAVVTGVSISPSSPKTNTAITATAAYSNLDQITGLQFGWYLNGVFVGTTQTSTKSFGLLSAGSKTIEVGLVGSNNSNHLPDKKSITFNVTQASTGGTGGGGGSFLAGTLVRMSDNTLQKVENIKLGDELKGSEGNVKVTDIFIYESDAKKYRLNDEIYFVTETHPIMTSEGWKSFNPEGTKIKVPTIEVSLLQKDDILIKEDEKQEILDNTDFITGSHLVYNFGVDNTNDYYANGYLVHNKILALSSDPGNPIP
jgi:hypothetical protein